MRSSSSDRENDGNQLSDFDEEGSPMLPSVDEWRKRKENSSLNIEEIIKEYPKLAEKLVETTGGKVLQGLVFMTMVFFMGTVPIAKAYALTDPITGLKNPQFIPQSPFVVSYIFSVLIANGINYAKDGQKGVKNCWDPWSILAMVPIAAMYALNEMMEMYTLKIIDPTFWKILSQSKLPITAVLSFFILKRKQTLPQFITIILISMQVATFSSLTLSTTPSAFEGLPIAFVNIMASTTAGLLADFTYKRVPYGFVVQMSQRGSVSSSIAISTMFIWLVRSGNFGMSFFYGWHRGVFILVSDVS
eukprot:GHVP01053209.1.p1 GENE.GHVP01053209.1~~GHVP01053209.1.p1  ORF type:complete len:303 (-),score=48.76 GHVP01053209.1:664-1572(-)